VETEILHACTKQCTESYVNIYLGIFLFQIITIHIKVVTETEEVVWIMEGTVCAEDYILWENTLYIKERIFINQRTVLEVRRAEFVSDRILHIVMRGCR
jgi:hypothetical protein